MELTGYLKKQSGYSHAGTAFLYLSGLTIFCLAVALVNPVYSLILGIGILFFLIAGLRPSVYMALFVLYVTMLPNLYIGREYDFFSLYYIPHATPIFFSGLAALILMNEGTLNLRRQTLRKQYPWDYVDYTLFLILAWIIFQAFRGLAYSHNMNWWIMELVESSMFLSFFAWRYIFEKGGEHLNRWIFLVVIAGALTSVEYQLFVVNDLESTVKMYTDRMVTRQAVATIVYLPFIYLLFAQSKKFLTRLGLIPLLLLAYIHVFTSLMRILWITAVLATVIFTTLYIFRNGASRKAITLWLTLLLLFSLFIVLMLFTSTSLLNVDLSMLLHRFNELGTTRDESTLMRIFDIRTAFSDIIHHPLIGYGVGHGLFITPTGGRYYFIDNSYLVAWLKGGAVYVLLLLALYLFSLRRAWRLFRYAKSEKKRVVGASFVTIILMILLHAGTAVSLIYYRHIFLWMMILAATSTLYRCEFMGENPVCTVAETETTGGKLT